MRTVRQNKHRDDLLVAIKTYRAERHISPTLRELGEMVGISSTSIVKHHIGMLARAGMIQYQPNTSRSIVPTEELTSAPCQD